MAWYQSAPPRSSLSYNLLHHLEVRYAVKNPNNSVDYIFDMLKSALTEKQIREIIFHWFNCQFQQSNNFQILSKFHKILHKNQLTTIQIHNNNHNNNTNINSKSNTGATCKVFQIQSLLCAIFSYLDFKSWLQCSKVNLQWLFDSYHPASLTHLDTNDLCKQKNLVGKQIKHKINKFKHIQSLKISCWCQQYNEYFGNLKKFLNISKLELDVNNTKNEAILMSTMNTIVENNKNRLKKLTLKNSLYKSHSQCKVLESVFLPHLEVLVVNGVKVQGFFLNKQKLTGFGSNNNNNSNSNFNNLQHIEMDDSHLGFEFWRDMADNRSNLSNITNLSLTGCKIDNSDENIKLIEANYIAEIARKLNNLTHFTCTMGELNRRTNSDTDTVSKILPSFLHNLSNNEKARESLNSLDVCLTSEWFFKTEKLSTGATCSVEIKTDECILNFGNLNHVSICFQEWSRDETFLMALCEQSHGLWPWPVQKSLGLFCSTQHSQSSDACDDSLLQPITTVKDKLKQRLIHVKEENKLSVLFVSYFFCEWFVFVIYRLYFINRISKKWSSNVKSLKLSGVDNLIGVSPGVFIEQLSNIKFSSMKKFFKTTAQNGNEYCDLQTKEFQSTRQLGNAMKSLNNNKNLINSINDIYFKTAIDGDFERTAHFGRGIYFDEICDILSQWYDNENKNVLLRFTISSTNDRYTDFKYSEKFGMCLCNKIDKQDRYMNTVTVLEKEKFVSPYYGGNDEHFRNIIDINDRLKIGIHMTHRNKRNTKSCGIKSKVSIEFIVKMLAKRGIIDNYDFDQELITCMCQYEILTLGMDDEFGDIDDDEFGENEDWGDVDDEGWGSAEDLDVFQENRMKKELTVKTKTCMNVLDETIIKKRTR